MSNRGMWARRMGLKGAALAAYMSEGSVAEVEVPAPVKAEVPIPEPKPKPKKTRKVKLGDEAPG